MFSRKFTIGSFFTSKQEKKNRNSSLYSVCVGSKADRISALKLQAAFSVEASLVLGVVFMTIAALLKYSYTKHDMITGTMILEETVQRARIGEKRKEELTALEQDGESIGNPRLLQGKYELTIESTGSKIIGVGKAGEWECKIEEDIFKPGDFLRRTECLKRLTGEDGT